MLIFVRKISDRFILKFHINSLLTPLHFRCSKHVWFHTFCVKQLIFGKVYDVKFNFFLFLNVEHLEEVPACMSFCVWINSHEQIILVGIDCNGQIKVSSLKLGTEFNVLVFPCRVNALEKSIFAGPDRKILLRFLEMLKFEPFDRFFWI